MIRQTPDRQLLRLDRSPHPSDIWGHIGGDEGARLSWLAARVPLRDAIVEVGSLRGRSTCYLGLGSLAGKGARVVAVDRWADASGTITEEDWLNRRRFDWNVRRFGLEGTVAAVRADAVELARVWRGSIGLLFLDGDHCYEGVRADYEGFSPHICRRGWLAIHDYCEEWAGVKRFVDDVVLPSGEWERPTLRHTLLTMRRAR